MCNFAALIFVGPGETEARRLCTLCESLVYFEPDIQSIVIIDDSSKLKFHTLLSDKVMDRVVVLLNPRNGRGNWWTGGLNAGLCTGLDWLSKHRRNEFVIRLDTDSLVIGAFSHRIRTRFTERKECGILGTYKYYPANQNQRLPHPETSEVLDTIIRKSARRWAVWRHPKHGSHLQLQFRRRDSRIRRLVQTAIENNYERGFYVQGGGYAISSGLLDRLIGSEYLDSPLDYLHTWFGEDVLVSLMCYATGFAIEDFNGPGEVFGVANHGISVTPQQAIEHQFGILHSIKNDAVPEEELVKFFANQRPSAST